MIIMPDADLDQAASALMGAGYGSAGERAWRSLSQSPSEKKQPMH